MVGTRAWVWLVAVTACGGFAQPPRAQLGTVDGGPDDDSAGFQDAGVGFDADPPDAFAYLDGPVVDGAPQGMTPTSGTVTVTGTTDSGQTLTVAPSGWSLGSPAGDYHYKWQRCTTSACTSTATIGTDSPTYKLASGDGGYYIRGGIYAINSCSSGCGQTATVYSSAHGAVRNVVTAKGPACCVSGCCSSACAFVKVSLSGFPSGSHTVKLYASNFTGGWLTYTTSNFPSEYACWGYSGKTVWSTVDSLKSNVVTW